MDFHIVPDDAGNRQIPRLLYHLKLRFPNITRLTLQIRAAYILYRASDIMEMFTEQSVVFPRLVSFHLSVHTPIIMVYSSSTSLRLLFEFLRRHSSTLRDLTLPPWHLCEETPSSLVQLNLRSFSSSLCMAQLLAPNLQTGGRSPHFSLAEEMSLQNMESVSGFSPFSPRKELDDETVLRHAQKIWPYPSIRFLSLIPTREEINFKYIPRFFPQLEELRIDFRKLVLHPRRSQWRDELPEMLKAAPALKRVTVLEPSNWRREYALPIY